MAKHSPSTAAGPATHSSADPLEEANASLLARIAELEQELTDLDDDQPDR